MSYPYDSPGPTGFLSNLPAGVRAGLITGLVLIIAGVISSLTAGAAGVLCFPVLLLFYVGNGALAGHFAGGGDDAPKAGALAGLIAWGMSALYYLVVAPLIGLATVGLGFLDIARWVLCGPIDLAVQVLLGALGGWAYSRMRGGSGSSDIYNG